MSLDNINQEYDMDGAITPEERFSWMTQQLVTLAGEDKRLRLSMDDQQKRVSAFQREYHRILNDQQKIGDAIAQLEEICHTLHSENKKLRERVSRVEEYLEESSTASENPEESYDPIPSSSNTTMESDREDTQFAGDTSQQGGPSSKEEVCQVGDVATCSTAPEIPEEASVTVKLPTEGLDETNTEMDNACAELTDYMGAISQQGHRSCKKRAILAAEIECGSQFPTAVAILENELNNRITKVSLERTNLEEKLKRTFGNFARLKLLMSRLENSQGCLKNALIMNSGELRQSFKVEIDQMSSTLGDIENKTSNKFFQWQVTHNRVCEISNDVKQMTVEANGVKEKVLQLCRTSRVLHTERMELISQLMEKIAEGLG